MDVVRRRIGHRTLALLAVVAVVCAGAIVTWVRVGTVARGTGWAEDSGIFLRERFALGPVRSLLEPYAGYLHLLPRAVVDVGVARPIADYALTVAACSCAVVGVVCGTIAVLCRDVVRAVPLRAVLGLVPAFLPLAPVEIAGNAANLHWYLLLAAPWVFAARPRTRWGAGGTAVLALVVTLSEVQAVLFLPLLALAWIGPTSRTRPTSGVGAAHRRRVPLALPVTVAAVAGTTAQVVTAATNARMASGTSGIGRRDLVAGYLVQVVGGASGVDVREVGAAVGRSGWAVVAVPAVVVLVLVLGAAVIARWRTRTITLALLVGSGVVWAAGVVLNPGADQHWTTVSPALLAQLPPLRYAAAASALLLGAVVLAAAVLVDRSACRPLHAVGWVLVAAVIGAFVIGYDAPPGRRADGPEWRPQFTDALVAGCRSDPAGSVVVDAAPWGGRVPCSLVLHDDDG